MEGHSELMNCPDTCLMDRTIVKYPAWSRDVGNKYIVEMELVEDLIKTLKEIEDDHKLNRFPKLSRYYNPDFEVVLKMPKTPEEKLELLRIKHIVHEANYFKGGVKMKLTKLLKVWKNKWLILKGVWNKAFPKPSIEEIFEYRLEICRDNYCGKYDKYGTSEEAVLRGEETCAACGCNLSFKLRVMEEACGLKEIGEKPLWTAETRYK